MDGDSKSRPAEDRVHQSILHKHVVEFVLFSYIGCGVTNTNACGNGCANIPPDIQRSIVGVIHFAQISLTITGTIWLGLFGRNFLFADTRCKPSTACKTLPCLGGGGMFASPWRYVS